MTLYEGRVTKGRATAVVEQEVVIIPPHTYKFFSHYNIYNRYFFDGDKRHGTLLCQTVLFSSVIF